MIIVFAIYFNNKINSDLVTNEVVSIITLDEYRDYVEEYNNNSTIDYFQDKYIKIKITETLNGIVYNYGIIFPYYIWENRKYNEIQKHAIYFADDYSVLFNAYDLSALIGTINIEPNNIFRVGLKIQSRNLNTIINPKKLNNLDSLSFKFTEEMVNMLLQNSIN